MRSLRIPVPTWLRRIPVTALACFSCSISYSLLASIRIHFSRFCCWLRSSWQVTTIPEGLWISRTAEEVLFTCCPPAPEAR